MKLLVTYTFPDKEKRDGFLESCRDYKIEKCCMKEDGCIRYEYEVPEGSDTMLLLHEEWEDPEFQKMHLDTPHMASVKAFKSRYHADSKLETLE